VPQRRRFCHHQRTVTASAASNPTSTTTRPSGEDMPVGSPGPVQNADQAVVPDIGSSTRPTVPAVHAQAGSAAPNAGAGAGQVSGTPATDPGGVARVSRPSGASISVR
jgi:hypothetical protein